MVIIEHALYALKCACAIIFGITDYPKLLHIVEAWKLHDYREMIVKLIFTADINYLYRFNNSREPYAEKYTFVFTFHKQ